jgi:drug/metabolite transporter (DMT)-like permease
MNPKISLIIGIICISFSPILVKLAGAPPVTSTFYRVFFGWLLLAPYCIIKGKYKLKRKDMLIAMLGGVIFASDIAVWNISILKISATVSTLLANLTPVWVGLLTWIILKRRSGATFWIGTVIAIIGMIILVGYHHILNLEINSGILLAVLASFLYANYLLITKNILQRVDTLTFMFYNMLAASMFLLVISLAERGNMVNFTPVTWYYFLAMGIVCQLIGWVTINFSVRYLEPTKISVALLSQTVMAGLLAIVLLHESLGMKEVVGSVIVLAGIAVTFLKRKALNQL